MVAIDCDRVLLLQMWRVLQPGGVYLIFSHASPERRLPLLQQQAWLVTVTQMSKPSVSADDVVTDFRTAELAGLLRELQSGDAHANAEPYYVYTCVKQQDTDDTAELQVDTPG